MSILKNSYMESEGNFHSIDPDEMEPNSKAVFQMLDCAAYIIKNVYDAGEHFSVNLLEATTRNPIIILRVGNPETSNKKPTLKDTERAKKALDSFDAQFTSLIDDYMPEQRINLGIDGVICYQLATFFDMLHALGRTATINNVFNDLYGSTVLESFDGDDLKTLDFNLTDFFRAATPFSESLADQGFNLPHSLKDINSSLAEALGQEEFIPIIVPYKPTFGDYEQDGIMPANLKTVPPQP